MVDLGDAVLHFANNGADLSPEGREAVEAVAQQLKAYPGGNTVMVSGPTSSLGKAAPWMSMLRQRRPPSPARPVPRPGTENGEGSGTARSLNNPGTGPLFPSLGLDKARRRVHILVLKIVDAAISNR